MPSETEQRDKSPAQQGRVRARLVPAAAVVAVTILLFALIEGFSSLTLIAYHATKNITQSWLLHTRYDSQLGWEPVPNVFLPDIYGKGVYVRTNSRGFRNNREFPIAKPSGKIRIICSGDSFTFGMSVDNDHTWCQELANRDARIETINMGQIGYGIDQAYLLYLRDGAALEHDVHILAFIARDLPRMGRPEHLGYGKPTLHVDNGRLAVRDTPVPRLMLRRRLAEFANLSSVQLLRKMGGKLGLAEPREDPALEAETRRVALKIFGELNQLHKSRSRLFMVVYLPWAEDYAPDPIQDERREFLRRQITGAGIAYADLTGAFRKLDRHAMEDLFVREKRPWPEIGWWGHYSVEGNRFAVSEISRQLMANEYFSRRIRELPRASLEQEARLGRGGIGQSAGFRGK